MDTGNGNFVEIKNNNCSKEKQDLEAKYPNHGAWFRVGQHVEIDGSIFRIKSVKPTELRLKLLIRN